MGYFLQLGLLNTHFNSLLTALFNSKSWKDKHLLSQIPLQVRWPCHLGLAKETEMEAANTASWASCSAGGLHLGAQVQQSLPRAEQE